MDNGVLAHLLPAIILGAFAVCPAAMFIFALFYAIFSD